MRVLLADDTRTKAQSIRMTLESRGFYVRHAVNGVEALKMAREDPPDLILSDVLMPELDGFQLCRAIRQDPLLHKIPVVLVTATFGQEDREFAISAGADAYIDQKTEPDALADFLRDQVNLRRKKTTVPKRAFSLDDGSFHEQYEQRLRDRLVQKVYELRDAYEAMSTAYDSTLAALVSALDLRDTETEVHSWRTAEYTGMLAVGMGISDPALTEIRRGSLLHDIGKIGLPDNILRKPGALTEDEWAIIRTHPELGYRMVAGISFLEASAEIVLSHHERWDGGGYPRGLKGHEIPLGARIFAVSDTVDAITSNRPYRDADTFGAALKELERCIGEQFDPLVVDAALAISESQWKTTRQAIETKHAGRPSGVGVSL